MDYVFTYYIWEVQTGNRANKSPLIIKMLPSVKANASGIWEKFLLQKISPIQHVLKRYLYRHFCQYAYICNCKRPQGLL